jgi:hypothetical protein
MKIKSGSLDPDPDIFFVNTGPEHISYTYRGILMKLHRNVHHYERQCHAHKPGL